ncbi:MAG: DUF402 domain-containing protein [Acidobacteriota bacterium]
MDKILRVNAKKFDGRVNKEWEAAVVEHIGSGILVKGVFAFDVDHIKLGFLKEGTLSYEYYWPDRWYNVFRFHEPDGSPRSFYCNVAMPALISDTLIEYVDLDIDLIVDREFNYEILDLEEFEERRIKLAYPEDVVAKAKTAQIELVELVTAREFPFVWP